MTIDSSAADYGLAHPASPDTVPSPEDRVLVSILNWFDMPATLRCVENVLASDWPELDIIVIDNGSRPEEFAELKERFAQIRTIRPGHNLGFAGGNNLAARSAAGEYLVMLNNDAFPEEGWLETLHQAAVAHPNYCFASRLLLDSDPSLLDGEWNVCHASGLVWRKNHNQPATKSAVSPRFVMSACAAASAYPRGAFEQVGGFDERFIICGGDVDLCIRMNEAGYQTWFVGGGYMLHKESISRKFTPIPPEDFYNSYLSYVKGYDPAVGDPFLPEITKSFKVHGA